MIGGTSPVSCSTPINNDQMVPFMRMLQTALLTLMSAVFFACIFVHALSGWPTKSGELIERSVFDAISGGLQIGLCFGSIACMVFGAIMLQPAIRIWHHQTTNLFPVIATGFRFLVLVGMGIFLRGLAAHYETFAIRGMRTIAAIAMDTCNRS